MLADTSRMPFGPLEGRGTEARSRRSGTRIGRAGHWARDRGGGGQGPGSGDNRSDRSGLQDASDWRDQTGSFWRRAAQQRGVVAKARSPMQSLAEMGLGQAGGCADGALCGQRRNQWLTRRLGTLTGQVPARQVPGNTRLEASFEA